MLKNCQNVEDFFNDYFADLDNVDVSFFFFFFLLLQAQHIHDRNTASHSAVMDKSSAATPEKVQMTWTKEKLIAEKHKIKDLNAAGYRDLFNMKP